MTFEVFDISNPTKVVSTITASSLQEARVKARAMNPRYAVVLSAPRAVVVLRRSLLEKQALR